MKYFEIGKIVNTQGVKGDVRVIPMTDDIRRFDLLKSVLVCNGKTEQVIAIEQVWYHKKFVIIKFEGVHDMNTAEKLRNSMLKIEESEALPLNEDEYYIRDLYEMDVIENGEKIGVIKDILFTGANDVYVVKNQETNEEILIPAIKQCILKVDVSNNQMIVSLLTGLRENK